MDDRLNGKVLDSQYVENLFQKNIDYYNKLAGEEPEFDLLRLYFGEDYRVNDKIVIHQPHIQDILDMGEKKFYSTIAPFTTNTTSFRSQLWDMKIDWNDISDFELFSLLIKTISLENSKIFFDDIDFSTFELMGRTNTKNEIELILYSEPLQMEIDEQTYLKIRKYMCFMFNVKLTNEFCKIAELKPEIIAKDKADLAKKAAESKGSNLVQMISFALNHPGFKYKKEELREVGYVEFIDSIKRLQIYESTRALTQGSYSGFCDTSKIPKENFNFMRSVDVQEEPS